MQHLLSSESQNMQALLNQFQNKNVLIIGDVMLDAYITGSVDRISPEAPVPVVFHEHSYMRLGGAANVALNIKSLKSHPYLIALIGKDQYGTDLRNCLQEAAISSDHLVSSDTRCTTVKTRILSKGHQLLRIDQENLHDADANENQNIISKIKEILSNQEIHIAILEDYNKGVLNEKNIPEILSLLNERKIPIAIDPKVKNFDLYQNVTLFKPNLKELIKGIGSAVNPQDRSSLREASHKLRAMIQNRISLLTLSEHGMYIEDSEHESLLPTHSIDVSDVSGAGDTVISIAALAVACGASIEQIATLANIGAGIVCQKPGVVSITFDELSENFQAH